MAGLDYKISDLENWAKKIEEVAAGFGLDWYPQEFEVIDYETMLGLQAYHGIPSYYPHWSFGKAYERNATFYGYGFVNLPYELVINTNPCIAYLMDQNPLALQILTIAHVYAHNNFFKNNVNFQKGTRAELALEFFHASAERIRGYIADPTIGHLKVEKLLNAAHALMYHCSRVPGVGYATQKEKKLAMLKKLNIPEDEWEHLKTKKDTELPDLTKTPLEPEENIVLFIRDHSPRGLEDWERDILTIVAESFDYFKPQILTKIANEGWASYWHHRIIRALNLSADLRLAIADYHSGVVCAPENPLMINPYWVGFTLWNDIFRKYEEPTPEEKNRHDLVGGGGLGHVFHVMRTTNDSAFLRAYLTKEVMEKLNFFSFGTDGQKLIVDQKVEDETWRKIKALIIRDVGMGLVPDIRIKDADYEDARSLYLIHNFDDRHLDNEYAQKTIEHIHHLWGRPVYLETFTFKRQAPYIYKFDGKNHSGKKRK